MEQRIAYALRHDPVFRETELAEGIDPDKTPEPASLSGSGSGSGRKEKKRGERGARMRVRAKL